MNSLLIGTSSRVKTEIGVLVATFLTASVLFGVLVSLVTNGVTNAWDESILLWINQHASPAFDEFFLAVTKLGGTVFVPIICLVLAIKLFYEKQYTKGWFVVVGMGGAMLLNVILKAQIERTRPDLWEWLIHESSLSFPSGHATASMALALIVVMLVWRTKWRLFTIVSAGLYVILVGVSRLYLGVHFPTDILGGWLLSVSWISLTALGFLLIGNVSHTQRKAD